MLKKKLIALLLASSMVLTGFVSVYGAEDFTDPGDGSAMESVTENGWDEGSFSDTEDGDFTSEESGVHFFLMKRKYLLFRMERYVLKMQDRG